MQEELRKILDNNLWAETIGHYKRDVDFGVVVRGKSEVIDQLLKLIEEEKEKAYQKGYDQCGEDLADEFNPNRKKYKEKRND